MMDISATQKAVHQTAQEHGWWDTADDCNVPTKLALIHSEVSEALEAYRAGGQKLELYYQYRNPDTGKLARATPTDMEDLALQEGFDPAEYKPMGFGVELADTMIRIFDLAEWMDIDLDTLISIKAQYNATRPMRHGGKKV
jgi:NTP pyrophosphatase (non-canonical NTP hydrolase)